MNATAAPARLESTAIDLSRRFIPERFTPLAFTAAYSELPERGRLRYNQLQALYFNEQITFFETALGRGILDALLRAPDPSWPPRLAENLRLFRDQEREHTEMFRALNRRAAPEIYGDRDLRFVQVPGIWLAASRWAVAHPALFPMLLWLMLLQEERSLHYSRGFLADSGVEPQFVQAHRRHLADEVWHVRWDEELLDALWARAHPLLRAANARLFAWMLEELFGAPKRAQLRVLDELARELPGLRPRLPELRRQVLALGKDARYRATLYSREIVPATFARFDATPEFRKLALFGYRPQPHPQAI